MRRSSTKVIAAASDLVAPLVQRDFAAFEDLHPAGQPRLVRRADDANVGRDLGTSEVVVDQDRRRRVDVDANRRRSSSGLRFSVRSRLGVAQSSPPAGRYRS